MDTRVAAADLGLPGDAGLPEFRDLARRFCADRLRPNQDRWIAGHHVDPELWPEAGKLGLLGLSVPEEYGGGGGTLAHTALLIEEQARAGDTCWGFTAHEVATLYVLRHGTEEQRSRWLPELTAGRLVGAIAITEPDAGSDLQGLATRAVRDGDEYVVHGQKMFVTNGVLADLVVALVRIGDGFSILVIEPGNDDRMSRGRPERKIGRNGQDTCPLFFDGARVPADNLLGGEEGAGMAQLLPMITLERLFIAVGAVGSMEAALADTIRYTRTRKLSGRPLSRFQNTQFTLAECATEAALVRTFVSHCLDQAVAGRLQMTDAAMAKLAATDRLCRIVDDCLQLFGGYGYLDEFPIARAWADARITRIYGGANEVMKDIIARSL
jgi:acyl-CoA dehydrogenase